jgi:hypothetical protein
MLARSLGHFRSKRLKYNFIQHCFCDLGSHFEALESVLLMKKYVFVTSGYKNNDVYKAEQLSQFPQVPWNKKKFGRLKG